MSIYSYVYSCIYSGLAFVHYDYYMTQHFLFVESYCLVDVSLHLFKDMKAQTQGIVECTAFCACQVFVGRKIVP